MRDRQAGGLRAMSARGRWSALNAALAVLAAMALPGLASAAVPPNIVFLYADDQAAWTVAAGGNRQARTPNLDRLYREGVTLPNAFTTTPVCSPSRAGLMTSRYGSEVGITDYLSPSAEPLKGLDQGWPTWPALLQGAGYRTAFIGKWHLGSLDRHLPTNHGYDSFFGFRVGAATSKDPQVERDGRVERLEGYTPDLLADEAIRVINSAAGAAPFLLSVHFWAPHANTAERTPDGDRTWLPLSEADWRPFRDLDVRLPEPDYPGLDIPRARRMLAEYLGSVASLDRNVGRILDALDQAGISKSTVVVFTSDHGYNLGHNGIWHKGNGRWLLVGKDGPRSNMYDRSIRVPAVVRWPARLQEGKVVREPVLNLDWFPTLLELAGVPLPVGAKLRGESFLPLLEGRKVRWRDAFYGEYLQLHQERVAQRMWRTPSWKLVRDSRPGMDELYNISRDPGERLNLIGEESAEIRALVARLERSLVERMREIERGP